MSERKSLAAGVISGVLGGLAASWVMDAFAAGPGKKLTRAVQSDSENQQQADEAARVAASGEPPEDATMKAADAIASTATGHHLSKEQKKTGGPAVHYVFGALMGGVYGGLAEYAPVVRAGFGTTFATALFTGADLFAVPVLGLGPNPTEQPVSALATPYAEHLLYGVTTEAVRRVVRALF